MRAVFSLAMLLLVALMLGSSEAARNKKEKGKGSKGASDCAEWRYGNCIANNGDCGLGVREGKCDEQTRKLKCKVPCNWKKQFGADCKYKFGNWGECDSTSNTKTRAGALKKALFHAECQHTIQVSKPCSQKTKPKEGEGEGELE
uniref:Midkine n=1 Tax=Osmerus mordax TaxID=8014 RepID=C1BK60_OSMMO|nr:Pleiotrophic factor-alpha-2 precursor [Osmerus mordax]